MIFLELFLVFSKIGIVNFGGGYAMLSLIQSEIVKEHHWLSNQEFTDIVAISQMTPGPIGVNVATYVGYTSVVAQGYPEWLGILGSAIATVSVLWLPFLLMLLVSSFLLKYKDSKGMRSVFRALRPAIVGLIAAAALVLMSEENFGSWSQSRSQFIFSIVLFVLGFVAVYRYQKSPLLIIGLSGILGILFYSFCP